MKSKLRVTFPVVRTMKGVLVDMPSPLNMKYFWKFGSLLGVFLVVQLVSGMFLAMHYVPDVSLAFSSVDSLMRDIPLGWFMRLIHAKGASLFFLFLYLHTGRKIYYFSFSKSWVWVVGVVILLVSVLTAFLGYVLVWGNMSFWAATVMTNVCSAIPYMGNELVQWVWGGFSVAGPTLTRFFAFHYLFPFMMVALVVVHIVFLHEKGSTNPLGVGSSGDKVLFYPYFVWKDMFIWVCCLGILLSVVFSIPYIFMDAEKFLEAKSLVTPVHMEPEWYFLPMYAVLRAIPNKLGGVMGLVMFIVILIPYGVWGVIWRGMQFSVVHQLVFWCWVMCMVVLLWNGMCVVEDPFISVGQSGSVLYFGVVLGHLWVLNSDWGEVGSLLKK